MEPINRAVSKVLSHEKTPLVLTIVSCTGVVITAVMTARAAPKAKRVLDELRIERADSHIPVKDMVKHTWKIYLPAVGAGFITIGSIITMNRVGERNAALLSASAVLATNTLKNYQSQALSELGPEKESKIRDKISKNALAQSSDLSKETAELLLMSPDDGTVVYDEFTGRYFKFPGTTEDLLRIENDLNRQILSENYVALNDVFDALGMEFVPMGEVMGFNNDNPVSFSFSAQLDPKRRPVLVLGYINPPVTDYNKL